MSVFIDAWGWLALEHVKDPGHREATTVYRRLRREQTPLHTSDYVMDETITRLFQRRPFLEAKCFVEGILDASEHGLLSVETVTPERFRRAWALRLKYDAQPGMSFTDLTSFAIMRELGIREVLTHDRHFVIAGFTLLP